MTNLSYDPRYASVTDHTTLPEAVVHSALVENLDRYESLHEVARHVVKALNEAGFALDSTLLTR